MATAQVNHRSLYLAYPCSVDAGVDPVKYTKTIISRIKDKVEQGDEQAAETLRRELCRLIPECDTSSNYDKLTTNAAKLTESWGYAVREDKTMMEDDMDDVAKRSKNMDFIEHGINRPLEANGVLILEPLRVIEEFLDEHITDVRGFLKCIPVQPPQNGIVRFLYLCGHGLSDEVARELRDNPADDGTKKSQAWPWELCRCEETMNRLPSAVTRDAQKGDIVVFSSGLLTPEWVVEKLREYEENQNRVENTIVIVIDACYSGTWIRRIRECLTDRQLQCTRVIVQTSCGEDEVSYGGCFTPVFCALQDTEKCAELLTHYKENSVGEMELFYKQSPAVYDNGRNDPNLFYFIRDNDVEFFEFCRKYLAKEHWESSRGIPSILFKEFFNSFSSSTKPTILCFRLKHMQNGSCPLAFFLIEWKQKKYHIHLHFNSFKDMKLTGISHVDVTNGKSHYQYTEDKDTKKRITSADVAWHNYIKPNETAMVEHFKNFAKGYGKQWNDENSWNMQKALPDNLIRSRSACFKETKEKYTAWQNLKL